MLTREEIAARLAELVSGNDTEYEVWRVQVAHRLSLVAFWGIPAGARVLEIGCGQGETTLALAHAVGPAGFVHGIDAAHDLAESRDALLACELGQWMRIDIGTDPLSEALVLPEGGYDYVVLSHCAWQFSSVEALENIMLRARKWGRVLCVAEWDLQQRGMEQRLHYQAAMIQGIYSCFDRAEGLAVRTLLYPEDLRRVAAQAGWRIDAQAQITSPDLQDGAWAVGTTVFDLPGLIVENAKFPRKLRQLLLAEIDTMKEGTFQGNIKPLPVLAFVAGKRHRKGR